MEKYAAHLFLLFGPFVFLSTQRKTRHVESKVVVFLCARPGLEVRLDHISEANESSRKLDSPAVNERSVYLVAAAEVDEPFMYATFASTRTDELAVTGWTEEDKERFLRMQFEAQRQSYLRDLPHAEYSVIRCGTISVGRLIVERTPTEIHIVDIALLTQFRKRGIGSILMERIFEEAKQTGKSVRLFVEKFNPALRLYRQMGFKVLSTGSVYLEMIRQA